MSDLRAVAKDALNFLDNCDLVDSFNPPTAQWGLWLREDLRAALAAEPHPVTEPMTTERHIALREAHGHQAREDYFNARPVEDYAIPRKTFDAGYQRGFDQAANLSDDEFAPVPQPLTDEQIAILTIMLDHYGNDPRTRCLRTLIERANSIGG